MNGGLGEFGAGTSAVADRRKDRDGGTTVWSSWVESSESRRITGESKLHKFPGLGWRARQMLSTSTTAPL